MTKLLLPVLFAFIASLGNALFAAGQKKAVLVDNALMFITLTTMSCVVFMMLTVPFFGPVNYIINIKQNWLWAVLSGFGLCITYIGFGLLYTRYGVSHYILYAVLSIITTSLITGLLIFRESFNLYHWLAFFCSMLTVFLFTYGNKLAQS